MLSYSFGPQLERPPIGRKLTSRLRAPKSILLVRRPKPDSYFLQILTQTSACFRCVTSPAPCHPVSSRTVMTSEWHLHPLARTRVNTCFNLTPNQPMCWAERFSAELNSKAWTEIPQLFHKTVSRLRLKAANPSLVHLKTFFWLKHPLLCTHNIFFYKFHIVCIS